jgi:6-phosphogluconolactonase (cycloisomerase 2 family)
VYYTGHARCAVNPSVRPKRSSQACATAGHTPEVPGREPARQSIQLAPFLYLTNPNSHNISGYAIDQSSGKLTPLAGSPFKGCGIPIAVAIDPSGRFAYVAISKTGICAFAIDPNSGALTKVSGSPFGRGTSPNRLTVESG